MGLPDRSRRLIVNADDFGRSTSINHAVIRAHREGILTSANLMVNEPWCEEAVDLARENPSLGVGLHLSLVCGKSALAFDKIPGLITTENEFSDNAVVSGLRFFFLPHLKAQIRDELDAQFARFRSTGLPLDHVNGHLNIHLHPIVFRILMENAKPWGIRHLRLTSDPLALNLKLAQGNLPYRLSHAVIYKFLSTWARPKLAREKILHPENVFGLLQNGRVEESFLASLLPHLPPGNSELYSHPSLDEFKSEFDALISPRVKAAVQELGIQLIRYQDF
ncbi:MAG: hopanoid biosynthesis-associated protein HpnK [Verrucomicrobiota bacterium]